jgi:hypothetical protein
MAMTVAEYICACRNIVALVDYALENDCPLPENYVVTLREYERRGENVAETWRGQHVTDAMADGIRARWAGLQKWDKYGKYGFNNDMFEGLGDVIVELQDGGARASAQADAPDPASSDAATRDGGGSGDASGASGTVSQGLEEFGDAVVVSAAPPVASVSAAPPVPSAPGRSDAELLESIARMREECRSVILQQIYDKHITVVRMDDFKYGKITEVLAATTSDRTHQLIQAAYHAGKVQGIVMLAESLSHSVTGKKE